MNKPRRKLYVGVCKDLSRHAFRSATSPLPLEWHLPLGPNGRVNVNDHALQFSYVIGPFRTKAGADYMRDKGHLNPCCGCVQDAEKLAKLAKEKAKPATIPIKVEMLQSWALELSQGDNSPRWAIETLLRENCYPTRNPNT